VAIRRVHAATRPAVSPSWRPFWLHDRASRSWRCLTAPGQSSYHSVSTERHGDEERWMDPSPIEASAPAQGRPRLFLVELPFQLLSASEAAARRSPERIVSAP